MCIFVLHYLLYVSLTFEYSLGLLFLFMKMEVILWTMVLILQQRVGEEMLGMWGILIFSFNICFSLFFYFLIYFISDIFSLFYRLIWIIFLCFEANCSKYSYILLFYWIFFRLRIVYFSSFDDFYILLLARLIILIYHNIVGGWWKH